MKLAPRLALPLIFVLCGIVVAAAQAPSDPTRPLIAPSPTEPSIVCGMRIVQGQSTLDPHMPKTPPTGNFTLQVHQPRVCRDMSRLPPLRNLGNLPNRLPTFLGPKR